jgi:hypothetical protein
MKGITLLENNPLTATLIREWFLEKMIESFKDETVPEDFKEMMRAQGIDNDKVGTLIDVNPRMLFDVFDDNSIKIHIAVGSDVSSNNFSFYILSDVVKINASQGESVKGLTNDFKTRKETEIKAIEYAFELLEIKLTSIKEKTNETSN